MYLFITPDKLFFKLEKKDNIQFENFHDRASHGTGAGKKRSLGYNNKDKNNLIELCDYQSFKNEFKNVFTEVNIY